jgi:hypothetical protein
MSTDVRQVLGQREGAVAALEEGSGNECGVRRGGASAWKEDKDDARQLSVEGGGQGRRSTA